MCAAYYGTDGSKLSLTNDRGSSLMLECQANNSIDLRGIYVVYDIHVNMGSGIWLFVTHEAQQLDFFTNMQ